MDITKFSFNLWVLRYKRYNEVRLSRSNFAGPQHFVINVFYCTCIVLYKNSFNRQSKRSIRWNLSCDQYVSIIICLQLQVYNHHLTWVLLIALIMPSLDFSQSCDRVTRGSQESFWLFVQIVRSSVHDWHVAKLCSCLYFVQLWYQSS